ncbi:AMP-binding protein [Muricoccus radiodurans]|uniref:AMP-binding protein n=1 Tax=Muricoccus radiodurans TaxID=2231721 RepID=UPI003CFB4B1A
MDLVAASQGNAYAAFRARFPQDLSRTFIESLDGRRVSYAALEETTARLANLLRSLGVGPGDRVAGLLDKSPEGIMLYLAACRTGAVYLPIHVDLTASEVDYILSDAEPSLLVCRPELAARLQARADVGGRHLLTLDARGRGTLVAAMGEQPAEFATPPGRAEDPNAIVYTSGTTGRPKGAIMTNGLVVWNALALAERWRITADDVLLHANPMAFGLFGTTTPVLAAGGSLRLLPKLQVDDVVAALPGVTMFSGVPTYYARLLKHPGFTQACCAGMRLFVTGSAPMRADLFDAFADRTGHQLLDRYGMTEALIITSMSLDAPRRPDTSGTPLTGCELRVVDEAGDPVPAGHVGMIELRQPFPFAGYWRAPEKTRDAFRPEGWFITGDFGRLDEDGNLSVLGRGVDLIISGGLNVYPKEVETGLNALPGVAESAVIGVPHPDFGEAVVAVVQLEPGADFSPAGAQAALSRDLARYKVPKHVAVVPDMPRNTLGKIQKALLKTQFRDLFAPAVP